MIINITSYLNVSVERLAAKYTFKYLEFCCRTGVKSTSGCCCLKSWSACKPCSSVHNILLLLGHTYSIGLKWIVILVFKYSYSFQMNSPNILLNIRNSKVTVFSDKVMLISIDWQPLPHLLPLKWVQVALKLGLQVKILLNLVLFVQ